MARRRKKKAQQSVDPLQWFCAMIDDPALPYEQVWSARAAASLARRGSRKIDATSADLEALLMSDARQPSGIPHHSAWTRERWIRAWMVDMRLGPHEVALLRAIAQHANATGLVELDLDHWAAEQALPAPMLAAALAHPPVRDYLTPLALPGRDLFLTSFPEASPQDTQARLQSALEHVWSYAP